MSGYASKRSTSVQGNIRKGVCFYVKLSLNGWTIVVIAISVPFCSGPHLMFKYFKKSVSSVGRCMHGVCEKLNKVPAEGRIACPFPSLPFKNIRLSPLGIIAKMNGINVG